MTKLLIVGNSHVGGLYGANKDFLNRLGYDKIQIALQNICCSGFDPADPGFFKDFIVDRENLLYKKQLSLGTDLSEFFEDIHLTNEESIDVLLVGLKLHGESVHELWGVWGNSPLPSIWPNKTYLANCLEPGPVTMALANEIYNEYYRKHCLFLQSILGLRHINLLAWIASPRPSEKSARHSYSPAQLDSGILGDHYRIDRDAIEAIFGVSHMLDYIYVPNDNCVTPLGLTPDEFFIADHENHVLGSFYTEALKRVFQNI